MSITARLAELGVTLPDAPAPAANYVPFVVVGSTVYVSGQISADADGFITGKLGDTMTAEEGAAVPILIRNSKDAVVLIYRVDADGTRHPEGKIPIAKNRVLRTQAGVVWEVRLLKGDKKYGFFVVPDKAHKVLIE